MRWVFPKTIEGSLIDQILQNREIKDKESFLKPTQNDIHSPALLVNIDKAVFTISEAIRNNKKIFIHGDFDVDGITATTIMWRYLYREANADITPYIPSRFEEGYGLSDESIQAILNQGGELIITVDCGVKDIDLVRKYSDQIDFVITDHHTIASVNDGIDGTIIGEYVISREAKAVVHPALGDYPFKNICGAAVSWKVCCALEKQLKTGKNMNTYLELVALGTVCDVMPLIDENRALVSLGIAEMRKSQNEGLKALFDIAGKNISEADTYHLGFLAGPRLNAAGRLEHAIDGVRLLSTDNNLQASKLAYNLNALNTKRQEMTQRLYEEALVQAEAQTENFVIVVNGTDWPEGLVGLIAGKLSQKFNKPSLVITESEEALKGSARSPEYFHLADALKEMDPYLLRHGGHAGAAGFSLKKTSLDEFKLELEKFAQKTISIEEMEPSLYIDAVLLIDELSVDLVKSLEDLGPFGVGNLKPLVCLRGTEIINFSLVGKEKSHLKLTVRTNDDYLNCIGFNMSSFEQRMHSYGETIDIVGYLDLNEWNGNIQTSFHLKDIRKAED